MEIRKKIIPIQLCMSILLKSSCCWHDSKDNWFSTILNYDLKCVQLVFKNKLEILSFYLVGVFPESEFYLHLGFGSAEFILFTI